jgi:hypothetical protein
MQWADSQLFAVASSILPASVHAVSAAPWVAQARQLASAVQAVHSVQQLMVRQVSHAALLDERPVAQMPVGQLVPSQFDRAQLMRSFASPKPSAWSVPHLVWQALSVHAAKQSSKSPQRVPESHAASSEQHDVVMQLWQVVFVLNWVAPQFIIPVEVDDDVAVDVATAVAPVDCATVVVCTPDVVEPPAPPLPSSPDELFGVPLLLHATSATIDRPIAQTAQDFMFMPPATTLWRSIAAITARAEIARIVPARRDDIGH